MILTGRQIQQKVQTGEIEISPFDPTHVNPNSYDLTLHNQMLTYELESNDGVLDMKKPNKAHRLEIPLGSPFSNLPIVPPSGSGVSRVIPAALMAREFANAVW